MDTVPALQMSNHYQMSPSQRHFVEHISHVQSDKIKKFSVSQTAEFESILKR